MFAAISQRKTIVFPLAALMALALAIFALPDATASPAHSARGISHVQARDTIANTHRGKITSVVRGEFGKKGVVHGYFVPDRFFSKGGKTYAHGVLHAKLVRGGGHVVGNVKRDITIRVNNAKNPKTQATCGILHLVLGPLHLNLLGLHVHLNKVILDIVAKSGAGNLLGNLLCAVAGLLDGSQLRLANILNRILTILRF